MIKVLEKYRGKTTKVCFDISRSDRREIPYTYRVPNNETIYAYIENGGFFSSIYTAGTILTEKAVYLYPKDEYKKNNRIAYTELYKYLLEYDDSDFKGLFLLAKDYQKDIRLVKGTIIRANIRANELYTILKDMQDTLYEENMEYREKRDEFCLSLLQEYSEKFTENGWLSDFAVARLFGIVKEEKWKKAALPFLEANAIRKCDAKEYKKIENVCGETLISKDVVFEKLINDLKNIDYKFKTHILEALNKKMEVSENRGFCGKYEAEIRIYALLKAGKLDELDELERKEDISSEEKSVFESEEYLTLKNYYNQKRMENYWNYIKENDDEKICLKKDGLLFTPLHYALILGKSDKFNLLMKEYKIGSAECYTGVEQFDALHRLDILADILEIKNANDISLRTSKEISSINKAIKGLQRYRWSQSGLIKSNEFLIETARTQIGTYRRNGNYEKVERLQENIQRAYERNRNCAERIKEIDEDIQQLEEELQEAIVDNKMRRKQIVQDLLTTDNVFIKKIIILLKNPEIYYKYIELENPELKKIHLFDRLIFIPKSWEITEEDIVQEESQKADYSQAKTNENEEQNDYNDTREEWSKKEGTNKKINKLYGNSWFSPDAHVDLSVLKKEFRILAKEYHPDHCKNPYATEIFEEILEERADIIEHYEA